MYAAIEAGGTKFICGYGSSPDKMEISRDIKTRTPDQTLGEVAAFFAGREIQRAGIACFGPLDIAKGCITSTTPKKKWRGFAIKTAIEAMLGCEAELETDVNGAALAEAKWGAARHSKSFVYVTVGTGIGGGVMIRGRLLRGLLHPEIGHFRVRRFAGDAYKGSCPTHDDCLEGLASGTSIAARWDVKEAQLLPDRHPAWPMTAHYLGQMVVNLTCAYSPEIVILGGGISLRPDMLSMVQQAAAQEMKGYVPLPEIVTAKLEGRAGVLGAFLLAKGRKASGKQ